jgi:hypothetical protein
LQDPILNQKKLGMVMYATGSTSRRTAVQASPRKNARPYPENKQSKKWSSTCLASTRLSLSTSTTKKQSKKGKNVHLLHKQLHVLLRI